jgi:hypothetical protein
VGKERTKPKPINQKTTNSERKNGKAYKTRPDSMFRGGQAYRGSRTTRNDPLTEVEKVLLGGRSGMLRNAAKRARAAQGI